MVEGAVRRYPLKVDTVSSLSWTCRAQIAAVLRPLGAQRDRSDKRLHFSRAVVYWCRCEWLSWVGSSLSVVGRQLVQAVHLAARGSPGHRVISRETAAASFLIRCPEVSGQMSAFSRYGNFVLRDNGSDVRVAESPVIDQPSEKMWGGVSRPDIDLFGSQTGLLIVGHEANAHPPRQREGGNLALPQAINGRNVGNSLKVTETDGLARKSLAVL